MKLWVVFFLFWTSTVESAEIPAKAQAAKPETGKLSAISANEALNVADGFKHLAIKKKIVLKKTVIATTTATTITTTSTTTFTTSKTTFTTTSTTTFTTTSTTTTQTTTIPFTSPIPGKCNNKDNVPVDVEDKWSESCKDKKGNSYSKGRSLRSCCGCFSYVCTVSQVYPFPASFNWTKEVSPTCCQTCNGTVVADGTLISTEVLNDKCGTVRTSTCVLRNRPWSYFYSRSRSLSDSKQVNIEETDNISDRLDGDAAVARTAAVAKEEFILSAEIEKDYHHENCCVDENGLHPVHTTVQEPSTCSISTCEKYPGWVEAAWVTRQRFSGCSCCLVDGKMVQDGFSWEVGRYPVEKWKCCKGEIALVKAGTKTLFE